MRVFIRFKNIRYNRLYIGVALDAQNATRSNAPTLSRHRVREIRKILSSQNSRKKQADYLRASSKLGNESFSPIVTKIRNIVWKNWQQAPITALYTLTHTHTHAPTRNIKYDKRK